MIVATVSCDGRLVATGSEDGRKVGCATGFSVGTARGASVGVGTGSSVGSPTGISVGSGVGDGVGIEFLLQHVYLYLTSPFARSYLTL